MKPVNPTTDLSRIIEGWAAQFPSKTALHFQGSDISYSRLWQSIEEKTATLDVCKGDRVAWLGYNNPEMLVLLFALARLGAILVPLNWRLTAAEHKAILADCAPKWIFSASPRDFLRTTTSQERLPHSRPQSTRRRPF